MAATVISASAIVYAGAPGADGSDGADGAPGVNAWGAIPASPPLSTQTDLQAALDAKQATLTGTADVPGLDTALAGKQATLTAFSEVPGLIAELATKQDNLTGTADVPGLDTALAGKAAVSHTHPQSEITNLVADLAAKQATLTGTSDVPGLDTALAGKQPLNGSLTDIAGLTLVKGDLLVYDGANLAKLAKGTDTHVLTADALEVTGLKWAAPATGGLTYSSGGATGGTLPMNDGASGFEDSGYRDTGSFLYLDRMLGFDTTTPGVSNYVNGVYRDVANRRVHSGPTGHSFMVSHNTHSARIDQTGAQFGHTGAVYTAQAAITGYHGSLPQLKLTDGTYDTDFKTDSGGLSIDIDGSEYRFGYAGTERLGLGWHSSYGAYLAPQVGISVNIADPYDAAYNGAIRCWKGASSWIKMEAKANYDHVIEAYNTNGVVLGSAINELGFFGTSARVRTTGWTIPTYTQRKTITPSTATVEEVADYVVTLVAEALGNTNGHGLLEN